MRVLVLGVYREPSGYGVAATNTILALHAAGADVACRPLQYTPGGETAHPVLKELERKTFPAGPDVTLQYAPPYAYQYLKAGGLNVGYFFAETTPLPYSWAARANLMDLLLVPNRDMAAAMAGEPHFHKPVEVVGVPQDPARYAAAYAPPACVTQAKRGGRFVFYAVGEWVRRKNFSGLLKAYFAAFRPWEPVTLLLKTSIPGLGAAEAREVVLRDVELVRHGCKLRQTPRVDIATERLTEDELCGLHQHRDRKSTRLNSSHW